jgi:hypothetical protein
MKFTNFTTVEYFLGGSAVVSKPIKLPDIGHKGHSVFLFDVVRTIRFWYWNLVK